ncbi:MAG: helix-turn-helix transcriptional regulator [Euzebyaceae bacterium]|jgi:transcriptional regulator with XRE-family HTH domain|nr:helix-turn-helix transcriptional regulator [Euzebyaceae bacterium]
MGMAADIILSARLRAGLSQRELARRAGTSSSTLDRYERGMTEPTVATVERLVSAAGFALHTTLAEPDRHDELLAEQTRMLTPEERLATLRNWARFRDEAAPAG